MLNLSNGYDGSTPVRPRRSHWTATAGLLSFFVIVVAALLTAAPPPAASPKISWSAPRSVFTLSPGETTSITTAFTSNTLLRNVSLQAVPELSPFVTTQPASFAVVEANRAYPVTLFMAVRPTDSTGTHAGTIMMRLKGQTIPDTLKLTINIWNTFDVDGGNVSFKYPPSLAVSTRASRSGTEIVLIDPSPVTPDLAVRAAIQLYMVSSTQPDFNALIQGRLSPVSVSSASQLLGGFLVEADDYHHLHFFKYSPISGRGLEIYGATDAFYSSAQFASLVDSLRF